MLKSTGCKINWLHVSLVSMLLFLLACGLGRPAATAIPSGRPANFEVQTITPTPNLAQVTATPPPLEAESAPVLGLGSAPTHTPNPNATATPLPLVTDTPIVAATPLPIETPPVEATPPQPAIAAATLPPKVAAVTPDPPLEGGDWDFEAEFIPWGNPYGEPCPGSAVAAGWTAFAEQGEYGSSCFNENLYGPNVFSGVKSQEMTFDFISANSGVFRLVPVKAGHRYTIAAFARTVPSLSPVEMYLGVDLTGGTTWNAATVTWYPWQGDIQGDWGGTEATITATANSITIFIRGVHPLAEQGGKTVIDNVRVVDLGL